MTERQGGSAAAARASRINGSLSKGPRSAAGKRASARNSLKHGLFRTDLGYNEAMSAGVSALAIALKSHGDLTWEAGALREVALEAAIRLEMAETLASQTRGEVAALLARDATDFALLAELLERLIRYGRYERRLRGRRDRAIRQLLGFSALAAC